MIHEYQSGMMEKLLFITKLEKVARNEQNLGRYELYSVTDKKPST